MVLPYVSKGAQMLDIGCGRGYVAEYLKEQTGEKIVGIDIVDKLKVNIPFVLYDGKHLPFKDKEFDLGLLIFVLHHAKNEKILLLESKRVAKTIVILEDTFSNPLSYFITAILDFILNLGKGSLRFRKVKEWENIFRELGLTVIEKKEFRRGPFGTSHCLFVITSQSSGRLEARREN